MKLRNLILIATRDLHRLQAGRQDARGRPERRQGPAAPQEGFGSSRTARTVSTQAQRIAEQATTKSLDIIKRARGSLRDRMGEYESDDAVWN